MLFSLVFQSLSYIALVGGNAGTDVRGCTVHIWAEYPPADAAATVQLVSSATPWKQLIGRRPEPLLPYMDCSNSGGEDDVNFGETVGDGVGSSCSGGGGVTSVHHRQHRLSAHAYDTRTHAHTLSAQASSIPQYTTLPHPERLTL
jgi:hypothetical protein